MKIPISCSVCQGKLTDENPVVDVYGTVLLVSEAGYYEFTCPKGHKTSTILNMQKYDLLFTLGVNAFIDCYYREAFVNFAASLERFYEFTLRVIARSKQINTDLFEKSWKDVSKQSERQFGAFLFSWLFQEGKFYTEVEHKKIGDMTQLRNEVVHKGKLATHEDCIEYGQYVVDIIKPIRRILSEKYKKPYEEEEAAFWKKISEKRNKEYTPGGILHIRSALDSATEKGFDSSVEAISEWRESYNTNLKHKTIICTKVHHSSFFKNDNA
jgi:hypothetical protein